MIFINFNASASEYPEDPAFRKLVARWARRNVEDLDLRSRIAYLHKMQNYILEATDEIENEDERTGEIDSRFEYAFDFGIKLLNSLAYSEATIKFVQSFECPTALRLHHHFCKDMADEYAHKFPYDRRVCLDQALELAWKGMRKKIPGLTLPSLTIETITSTGEYRSGPDGNGTIIVNKQSLKDDGFYESVNTVLHELTHHITWFMAYAHQSGKPALDQTMIPDLEMRLEGARQGYAPSHLIEPFYKNDPDEILAFGVSGAIENRFKFYQHYGDIRTANRKYSGVREHIFNAAYGDPQSRAKIADVLKPALLSGLKYG